MALLGPGGFSQLASLLSTVPDRLGNTAPGQAQLFSNLAQQARQGAEQARRSDAIRGLLQPQTAPFEQDLFPGEQPIEGLESVTAPPLLDPQSAQGRFVTGLLDAGLPGQAINQIGGLLSPAPQQGFFEGTGIRAQGFNTLIQAQQLVRDGQPLPPDLRDAVNLIASEFSTPRIQQLPDGSAVMQPPMDLSQFRGVIDAARGGQPGQQPGQQPSAQPGVGPTVRRKPVAPATAGALQSAKQGLADVLDARRTLFSGVGEDGAFTDETDLNRADVATGAFGVPGSQGRAAEISTRRAIEVILRARSGAAVPPDEVDNYMTLYGVSLFDDVDTAKRKSVALEEFFKQTMDLMNNGVAPGDPRFIAGDPLKGSPSPSIVPIEAPPPPTGFQVIPGS